jgi:hypothetical protein
MSDHNAITYQVNLSVKRQKKPEFFSIDFNNVFLNRVQFSSRDFSHRFSDSNIVQRSSMSFFTFYVNKRREHGTPENTIEINSHEWKRYLALSKKVKDAIKEAHRKYFDDILNTSITDNPSRCNLFSWDIFLH